MPRDGEHAKPYHRGAHPRIRTAALVALAASGQVPRCVYDGAPLTGPTRTWELAHNESRDGYLGTWPQHFACRHHNRSAGARARWRRRAPARAPASKGLGRIAARDNEPRRRLILPNR
jgi:hypothetical protein